MLFQVVQYLVTLVKRYIVFDFNTLAVTCGIVRQGTLFSKSSMLFPFICTDIQLPTTDN